MSITIKKATCTDATDILEYFKQIGAETDNMSFGAEGLPFTPEAEAAYISQIENSRDSIMILAKEDGKIVGEASLSRLPRRMNHRGDLAVSVLKECWNRGIGSQLLLEILKFAKENSFEIIDLQVRSDNKAAIHVYEKLGFKKIGGHPYFFKIDNKEVPVDYMFLNLI